MTYLIWSFEHDAWWRPDSQGYDKNINEAGIYLYSRACKIVSDANRHGKINEAMVPRPEWLK